MNGVKMKMTVKVIKDNLNIKGVHSDKIDFIMGFLEESSEMLENMWQTLVESDNRTEIKYDR